MRYFNLIFIAAMAAGCTNATTSTRIIVARDTTLRADTIANTTQAVKCDTVLPLAELKTGLKRWEDFYKAKNKGFALGSFRFTGCSLNKDMIVQSFDMPADEMKLYKPLLIFSPAKEKYIDLDSYNFILSKDKNGKVVAGPGDPETEIAVVDPAKQTRTRLAYYTESDFFADDACWIGENKVALLYLSKDEKGDSFSPSLSIIDLDTHIQSIFTCNVKISEADSESYTNTVRRKGIQLK